MRRKWAEVMIGLGLTFAASCTKDFSRFHFQSGQRDGGSVHPFDSGMDADLQQNQLDGSPQDGTHQDSQMSVDPGAGSGGDAPTDSGSTMPPKDAGKTSGDAQMPMTPDDDARVTEDAQAPSDASMPQDAAPRVDAQMPDGMQQCAEAYRSLDDARTECRSCTCDRCTTVALDCLVGANAYDRAACTNLWACAIKHGCRDWDCYCSTSMCRLTMTAVGDGPCVTQMNEAAGGTREMVNAAHQAGDPHSPLVRAVRAIGCTVGIPANAVGGPITEQCKAACGDM
jgi:hypothetical protein